MDLVLLDDHRREPLGRPYITVAVDTFSRMVAGFYISLDSPFSVSVAMYIQHAMATKESDLQQFDMDIEWPIWGPIGTLQTDNAKEFRSKTLKTACDEYGINLEHRPVNQPNFGGIIERVIGTAMKRKSKRSRSHVFTYSEKRDYDVEGNAQMTIDDLRRHMTVWIPLYITTVHIKSG